MILERGRLIRKLQPKVQLNRDYLLKKRHYFFEEQKDEKFKKKTRSDKFPLTLHPTGQYCKKGQQCLQLPALSVYWRVLFLSQVA